MHFRKVFNMVPDMHFWVIENITQLPVAPAHIRVIDMPHQHGEHMDHEELFDPEAYHCQWKILNAFVNHCFHKVKSELGRKPHFLHRVMYLMKFP